MSSPRTAAGRLRWRDLDSGEDGHGVYDSVIVANGHHWNPRWPEPAFEGQESFEGEQIHVHSYKEPDVMRGKRVMVLGIGNSATDLAVEASRNADRTFLAMRRGAGSFPSTSARKPTDELAPALLSRLPLAVQRFLLGRTVKKAAGVPTDYGLPEPDHKLAEAHPTVSSDLLPRLGHGDIEVKPNIARFAGGRTVEFSDGTSRGARPHRLLHRATRSRSRSSTTVVVDAPDNRIPLYRRVVHPDLHGLYFVGLVQPLGAIMPLAEAQSEWIADLLEGKATLPEQGAHARGDPARGRANGEALRRLEAPHDPGRLPPLHAHDQARARRWASSAGCERRAIARAARLVGRLGDDGWTRRAPRHKCPLCGGTVYPVDRSAPVAIIRGKRRSSLPR